MAKEMEWNNEENLWEVAELTACRFLLNEKPENATREEFLEAHIELADYYYNKFSFQFSDFSDACKKLGFVAIRGEA
jgi:hypothetical protein